MMQPLKMKKIKFVVWLHQTRQFGWVTSETRRFDSHRNT